MPHPNTLDIPKIWNEPFVKEKAYNLQYGVFYWVEVRVKDDPSDFQEKILFDNDFHHPSIESKSCILEEIPIPLHHDLTYTLIDNILPDNSC